MHGLALGGIASYGVGDGSLVLGRNRRGIGVVGVDIARSSSIGLGIVVYLWLTGHGGGEMYRTSGCGVFEPFRDRPRLDESAGGVGE